MKRKIVLLAMLCCMVTTAGCGGEKGQETSQDKSETVTAQEEQTKALEDYYLTYSCTNRAMMVSNGTYDFAAKEQTNNGVITNLTSQSSTAVYDEQTKNVLYADTDEDGNSQVYEKNLESGEVTPLTNHLWAITYIVPRKEDILIAGLEKDSHVIALWKYVRSSQEVERVDFGVENTDQISVWNLYMDPETEEVSVVAFDDEESRKRLEEYNNDSSNEAGEELLEEFYFFTYEEKEAELLFTKEMPDTYQLIGNGSTILYSLDGDDGCKYYKYDRSAKQEEEVDLGDVPSEWMYLSEDGNILYYTDGEGSDYHIYTRNIDTGETNQLPDLDMKIRANYGNIMVLKKTK